MSCFSVNQIDNIVINIVVVLFHSPVAAALIHKQSDITEYSTCLSGVSRNSITKIGKIK